MAEMPSDNQKVVASINYFKINLAVQTTSWVPILFERGFRTNDGDNI